MIAIFGRFLLILILTTGWIFSGWPQIWNNPPIPPETPEVQAVLPGLQHNWRWGLDDASSADIKDRPTVSGTDDTKVSIKVGAPTDSDQDPILRLQITNADVFPSGTVLEFVYTDCTNQSNLKTCATRILGSDETTSWVYVGGRSATGGKFRMRQMAYDTGDTLDGTQISRIILSAHNITAGAYMTKATTTTSFLSDTYVVIDISFEYYGSAPSVFETYLLALVVDGALVAFSAMHGTMGAILEIIPENWVGSAVYSSGISITGATTATATLIFSDDSDTDSTTDFAYAIDTEHPASWTTTCSSVSGGYDAYTLKDTTLAHKRTCEFSGLTADSVYWFKITHTDPDGYAGQTPQILGPYYTDPTKGIVVLFTTSKDSSEDSTDDTVDDLTYDDVESGTNPVKTMVVDDGQYTLNKGGDVMHLDSFDTAGLPASATLDKTWIDFQYGATGSKTYTHNLNMADAGTEPSACAAGGSPGANWTSVWSVGSVTANDWVGDLSSSFTGYTLAQLGTLDVCLNNSSSGGTAHDLNFDHLVLVSSYTPSSATISAVTDAATQISGTTAQLNGTVDNRGASGVYYFEYGLTSGYGDTTAETYFWNNIGTQEVYEAISSLSSGTLYHFRVCVKAPPSATAVCGSDETFTTISGNSLPVASAVSIDSAAASVTLTESTTKSVVCAGTVTDTNGYADIAAVGAYFFRTSTGTSTPVDDNERYYLYGDSNCAPSGGSGNSETYTCTFAVEYYADATDATGGYPSDDWTCEMWPEDNVATGTPATDIIEMDSLLALSVTSSISYGTLNPDTDTGATNQTTTVTNTGNIDMDPQLSGDANMICSGNNIPVGQQKYSDAAFTYDSGGTALTTSAVTLNITLPQRTNGVVTDDVLWGIGIPDGTPDCTPYSGTNTFTATAGI